MLNVFTLANGRLFQEEIESLHELADVQPVWVDLEAPTGEEKGWIAQHFGVTIPEDAVDDDLEESARFYEEDNGELHIRSDFLVGDDTPHNVRVAFILFKGILFSMHAEPLPVFRLLRLRARRIPALIEDAKDVLLKLYDADAEVHKLYEGAAVPAIEAAFPGTTARPPRGSSPSAPSRVSRRRLALRARASGPWHAKHFSERTRRVSWPRSPATPRSPEAKRTTSRQVERCLAAKTARGSLRRT